MSGFSVNIRSFSIEEAELWAIFNGLKLAWSEGYRKLLLESDCDTVLKWLK